MGLKITFILPGGARHPSGGFKVVYEYANRLARAGHQVTLIHPAYVGTAKARHPASELRRAVSRYFSRLLSRRWQPSHWFTLEKDVRITWVPLLHPAFIPDADIIFATLWLTAEKVALLPDTKGEKYYLVQGLETWGGAADRVFDTWTLPLKKIAVSRWLQDEIIKRGAQAEYVPNGLDTGKFGLDNPLQARRSTHIGMLYSALPIKGSRDGIAALCAAHEKDPRITAELFGVPPRPEDLPAWIIYHQTPKQEQLRALYNRCAIFVSPSHSEGWGLTASEAMLSGTAVIATRIGGHMEFCIDRQTALMCTPGDTAGMASLILQLVGDAPLREKIASAGQALVSRFTWESSTRNLLGIIDGHS